MYLGRHTCLPWLFDKGGHREIPLLADTDAAPPNVIVVGDRRRVARVLRHLEDPVDLSAHCRSRLGAAATGRVELGVGRAGPVPVLVVETQMGGSAAEIIVREVLDESFHPDGARTVIRVGSCGALDSAEGSPTLCIGTFATGWSAAIEQCRRGVFPPPAEYPEQAPIVACSPRVVDALRQSAERLAPRVDAALGGIFSKDSLYSEQDSAFAGHLRSLGCIATEMELSTIGPIADSLEASWGGIMASAGLVPDGPWYDPATIEKNEDHAINVALEALRSLA